MKAICKQCKRKFTDPSALAIHAYVEHPGTYQCDECDERFSTCEGLETHLKQEHGDYVEATCTKCGHIFYSMHDFNIHMGTVHGIPCAVEVAEPKYDALSGLLTQDDIRFAYALGVLL